MKSTLLGAVLVAVLAVPTAAAARSLPLPPDASFGGTVNGASTHATIRVACCERPWMTLPTAANGTT